MKPEYDIVAFEDAASWRKWLARHHSDTDGIWLLLYKKASGIKSVTHVEALDDALCFGWIDGLRKGKDELSFLQKFTPRRKTSLWSKRNIEHIARLTEKGLMTPDGLAEIERAKADGRWDAAYDAPSQMVVPDYFLTALRNHPEAEKRFETLNKSSRYSIVWSLQTAKTDAARLRRMEKIIVSLETAEKI